VKEEATTLLTNGKKDLLLSNVPAAVTKLAQACEMLSKAFGETAIETGETYFYYGKSLLELSRMESGVLGNALEGVPEEDADGNTSQFEDPEKMTDQEKDQVNEVVTEAFEENFKELEDKKSKAEDSKKDSADATTEASTEASKKEDAEAEKQEEGKKEGGESEAKAEDEAMEEDEVETEEEEGADSAGETEEKQEGEASSEKKEDEEDEEPSNLQLAWEMLELAKVVFRKQLETGGEDKTKLEERLISTLLALGEVSIENGNYKQAVEDIQECLKKQEGLPKDARVVAETHYQLGVAQGFNAQFDEAVESLKNAINILKSRIANLQKSEDEVTKKEVADLEALIPEIEEKISDTKDMKKESEKKEAAAPTGDEGFGASKAAEVKPVSSIAVKRKAEDEDTASKKLAGEKETAAAS